ncbi:MAG: right-handed parallel beta-helix repeat-containing protein, partial [Myxococcota bacterium]
GVDTVVDAGFDTGVDGGVDGGLKAYFVSPGSASTDWPAGRDIGSPVTVQTAFENARAGDLVFFRGGTYTIPQNNREDRTYHGTYEWAASGTGDPDDERIVFRAFPGEIPVINGTTGGSCDGSSACPPGIFATPFAAVGRKFITVDGFVFQADGGTKMARFLSFQSQGIAIKNCTLSGGSSVATCVDNLEGIRIEQSQNVLVSNCRISGYRESTNNHNTSAIKTYNTDLLTFENNGISDSTNGIYLKRESMRSTVRYNFINRIARYGIQMWVYSHWHADGNMFFNNIIANIGKNDGSTLSSAIYLEHEDLGNTMNDLSIYNNTIYNNTTDGQGIFGGCYTFTEQWNFFDNIVIVKSPNFNMGVMHEARLTTCDHNQWGAAPRLSVGGYPGGSGSSVYTDLGSWQGSGQLIGGGDPGSGDMASGPMFLNSSGNMDVAGDFLLHGGSPCKGAGRSGGDMGADIASVGVR